MDSSQLEAATILVVDDIPANRALVRETLLDAGHRVVEAQSGPEALELFARELPDCVVLDVRMPGMDGFEVCRRMHELPGGSRTPVVFLTALRDLDTFDAAIKAGGFDFLTKPVDPSELLARVRAALMLKKTRVERDELTELLREQRDHCMRAVLLNERLAAFLVHDLKNPVSGMQLAAELIERDPQTSARSREIAVKIREQAGELLRMIMSLLDLSKGEEGRLTLVRTSIEPAPLIREILDRLALRAKERGLELTMSVEVERMDVDAGLFRRVIENLLDNALRHGPHGSSISVTLVQEGQDARLCVADQGRGVPPELRERIFDRFVQADTGYASRAGRGLGLAFCKLVVEAHGGTIWVEDANPGAAFCTRWPNAL